ncbi:hypothetical protein LBMAG42_50300 [Deltaproteobacteria bacterium]|nr:hypothetical protein LBMAG42_50300 [Deltaproteobacteria bacterium]
MGALLALLAGLALLYVFATSGWAELSFRSRCTATQGTVTAAAQGTHLERVGDGSRRKMKATSSVTVTFVANAATQTFTQTWQGGLGGLEAEMTVPVAWDPNDVASARIDTWTQRGWLLATLVFQLSLGVVFVGVGLAGLLR